MNCNKLDDTYNINRYTFNGKLLPYNKLKHKINEYESKKDKLSEQHKLYAVILPFLDDDENENTENL